MLEAFVCERDSIFFFNLLLESTFRFTRYVYHLFIPHLSNFFHSPSCSCITGGGWRTSHGASCA